MGKLDCPSARAAKCRLSELGDREDVVRDPVGSALRIENLKVKDAIDTHLDIVFCDADLFWISIAISFSECLYAIRSMKGMRI